MSDDLLSSVDDLIEEWLDRLYALLGHGGVRFETTFDADGQPTEVRIVPAE